VTPLTSSANGLFAIAPTPFAEDGAIDYQSIDRLVAFYESAGATGITVLGRLGESQRLTFDESVDVAKRFLVSTSLPVIVGASNLSLVAVGALTDEVMPAGAAGVMVAPEPTLGTDQQIFDYYAQIVSAIGPHTPLVLQDYPLAIGVQMSVPLIARLAAAFDNFVVLKHEDWPGLDKITALRKLSDAGAMPRISILCGNGGLFFDFELDRGCDGAMTGYCFPEVLVEMMRLAACGVHDEMHDLFDAHLPLVRYEQQPGTGLAVRKHVLARRGVIATDTQRQPGRGLSAESRAEVDRLLLRLPRSHDLESFLAAPLGA
jgi:4-hydroxy-tetrahydrodipicolinate synthase